METPLLAEVNMATDAGEAELLGPEPGGRMELTVVAVRGGGERIDRWLADRMRDCSRSFIQRLIREGRVLLGGAPAKAARRLRGGEQLAVSFPAAEEEPSAVPEDIPVPIVYEDEELVVVDKPAGMASHPSCGHARGTLANAMAFHCPALSGVGGLIRPGIVHRLDMDTSGLIVVAKTDRAHRALASQFADRTVSKRYLALVLRAPATEAGVIDRQLGRHPRNRLKQAVLRSGGRSAVTEYSVLERFGGAALLELRPRTGRTHQIRVHLASYGCPILCDALYGREMEYPEGTPVLRRQALHAASLHFAHPVSRERCSFESLLPPDMQGAMEELRSAAAGRRR